MRFDCISHAARSRCLRGRRTPGTTSQGPCRGCFANVATLLLTERVRRAASGSMETSKVKNSEHGGDENAGDETSEREVAPSDAGDDDAVKQLRHKVER